MISILCCRNHNNVFLESWILASSYMNIERNSYFFKARYQGNTNGFKICSM